MICTDCKFLNSEPDYKTYHGYYKNGFYYSKGVKYNTCAGYPMWYGIPNKETCHSYQRATQGDHLKTTEDYRYCNHHHELDDKHALVDFGDGEFVANIEAIPLLKSLNELGLKTRSHHIDENEHAWVCILLDNVDLEVKEVFEKDADRTKYNGKKELMITWRKEKNL